ncbi:gamma DNA-directed DNA polymerase [Mycena floridula]|nr:gamma DNA-directed DNA polymerase [Mycena floridula]
MLQRLRKPDPRLSRRFHAASTNSIQTFKHKSPSETASRPTYRYKEEEAENTVESSSQDELRHVKRNAAGVQLLSRSLHNQVFKNCSFPTPPQTFTNIALQHLKENDLQPSQSSTLPSTEFTLPQLQGSNLLEHFHRIGSASSEPYFSLARTFASTEIPPQPESWDIVSPGWTKYIYESDGSSYTEPVPYPMHDGQPEQILSFDIETMPKYHLFPIMACAVTPNGWYSWLSPWILDPDGQSPQHLIPMGPSDVSRVIVGHNVSYDRGRIQEEYHVQGTQNRFLDTMALHIAVKGISSNQRPAWMQHRKKKEMEMERKSETLDVARQMRHDVQRQLAAEKNPETKEQLTELLRGLDESLPALEASLLTSEIDMPDASSGILDEDEISEATQKRWEDNTSANSLVDVAKLHCDIDISKEIRNDFMTATPFEILENLGDYLTYCASDVNVTHRVYQKVLPQFLDNCPHPVSFAGVLTMGSGFLPVNQEWERYLERAETVYRTLEKQVKDSLASLALSALESHKEQIPDPSVDPWLSQLDWTPKAVGKSRGLVEEVSNEDIKPEPKPTALNSKPKWYSALLADPFTPSALQRVIPLLLEFSFDGNPLRFSSAQGWHYVLPDDSIGRPDTAGKGKVQTILSMKHLQPTSENLRGIELKEQKLAVKLAGGIRDEKVKKKILALAKKICDVGLKDPDAIQQNPWLSQLNWTLVLEDGQKAAKIASPSKPKVFWPHWYWELMKPKKDMPPGTLDVTTRNRVSPLLLKMSWHGYPLFHSREHGWIFRVPSRDPNITDKFKRLTPLVFSAPEDAKLDAAAETDRTHVFYKLPHKDGDKANVGSPLGKTFMKFATDGILECGAGDQAKTVVDLGVQCSYWVSARDRILNQMVVWQDPSKKLDMGFPRDEGSEENKWGMILPQVITMAMPKRIESDPELKAMVRAPPGYAIVGADVDSEELWISSCMGDAQFGFQGATAIGWMTLEGTKSAGTDLHSKTASILGITRDQAKVFNYSRIYGAGMRHAVLLLIQGNPNMSPEEAQKLAENLYASTKGKNTHRTDMFDRKFWFGGTESFLFNKLEEIATSGTPQTPALGCGVTRALSKDYLPVKFGADYLPSRINWVVQSSGVDYLHLLIVSMDYLIKRYKIDARYLISVHDELRYLVTEQDKYRLALAMQIANLWTRSMFAYKLGMDDLPQGVAFFSAVDVDHVLRKEVDMNCVTPSQPNAIPPGESMDIGQILSKTNGGSLMPNGEPMASSQSPQTYIGTLENYFEPDCLTHRAQHAAFLQAQSTTDFGEIKHLAKKVTGKSFKGGPGHGKRARKPSSSGSSGSHTIGDGEGVDWSEVIERLLKSGRDLKVW